jgi:hypothetical protein
MLEIEDIPSYIFSIRPDLKETHSFISCLGNKYVILKCEYGEVKTTLHHLKEGKTPTFNSALDKLGYVKNMVKSYFPDHEEHFEVIGTKSAKRLSGYNLTKVVVRTKYGDCLADFSHLKQKKLPSIQVAINKQDYFLNILKDKNKDYREGLFEIKSAYIKSNIKVIVSSKYGDCAIKPVNLFLGATPIRHNAVNKTSFFLNELRDLHPHLFKTLSFDKIEYINNNHKTKVVCKYHGELLMRPSVLLRGGGCEKCGYDNIKKIRKEKSGDGFTHTSWIENAKKSKNFDSYKVYILRCFSEDEVFYKIGKTFKKINKRFFKCNLPYNYEVIKVFESDQEGLKISLLESELKSKNRKEAYTPQLPFPGSFECFKKVDYEL